jgi:hypothetical protein
MSDHIKTAPVTSTDHSRGAVSPDVGQMRPDPSGRNAAADMERIAILGQAWVARNTELLASMPPKTVVAINVATDEFVSATDGLTAMDLFEARFGKGVYAWLHHNDGPITIGGGYWALFSGA